MIDYKEIKEYTKIESKHEIHKFIQYLVKNRVAFNGSQRVGGNESLEIQLFIEELNSHRPEVRVELLFDHHLKDLSQLNKKLPLYLYTNSYKYVAEVNIVYISDRHFFIEPPTKMLIKNHKVVPRLNLTKIDDNDRMISFQKNSKRFNYKLLDISKTGLAFEVHSRQMKHFQYLDDAVYINWLFGEKLPHSIQGKVIHATPQPDRPHVFHVGVQFFDEIELTGYKALKKIEQQA